LVCRDIRGAWRTRDHQQAISFIYPPKPKAA
jgi:hypothetical protein